MAYRDARGECCYRSEARQIQLLEAHACAGRMFRDLQHGLGATRRVAPGEDHLGACGCESSRRGVPDPAGPAGHHRAPSVKRRDVLLGPAHHVWPSRI